MSIASELREKHCASCEGDIAPLSPEQVRDMLKSVPDWSLTADGKRLRREWTVKDFAEAIEFFEDIAEIAQEEDHHPDLHLANYRNVTIEIWTHKVGGLTENDFILAAKIDAVPVELKK
ncbi:MAG TPA: 4a-hydroxytetrahydrobiopterin dehydratase [Gemmataceae bacterium]|nr:4a-hydroxytetrahydrobiopterin dehydratase [Gemmataceae bacterium]